MAYIGLLSHMKSSLSHVLKMELQQNGWRNPKRAQSIVGHCLDRLVWIAVVIMLWVCEADLHAQLEIRVDILLNAQSDASFWMHPRVGMVPHDQDHPMAVMTLQETDREGTHMYHGLSTMVWDSRDKKWSSPQRDSALARRVDAQGLIEVFVDATPSWHSKTGKILLTGATFWLDPQLKKHLPDGGSDVAYSVLDLQNLAWSPWSKLELPSEPKFHFARAGCTQRVDLPDGDILLPIYFGGKGNDSRHKAAVARCRFDGNVLSYLEHGNELSIEVVRGFVEPSLCLFQGRYLLTLRNDLKPYVAWSMDGLHFSKPQVWRFDDGSELESYNTQQHWLVLPDACYLLYTRRGLDNDDIFRHRSPLMMSKVDSSTLQLKKSTEREVLPKLKDGFGNFGVCQVSEDETWVTAGRRRAKPGEGSVYRARILW